MASVDLLQTLLQFHLATDISAVANIHSVLPALSSDSFNSSSHLAKWTNRLNSLIHSREPGARWAGITLTLHTSKLSRNILISSAQGWVSTLLPMLSRSENLAVWKASIRLLAFIFTSTTSLAEFQRSVVTPNIPKFSSVLLSLVEKQPDEELKILCLDVLATVVPLYPTLHRQLSSSLSTTSLNLLNGTANTTSTAIISSASRLHARLHTIEGKVGGAALWRKKVEETVAFCHSALAGLRTTYVSEGQYFSPHNDPLVCVPLNLDRLRCGVELLCHLLRTKVERPVPVPVQSITRLCIEILRVTAKGPFHSDVDPLLRSMEASAVPQILEIGSSLTACLSRCVRNKFAPHLTEILDIVAYHLEQPTSIRERLPLIKLLPSLFGSCLPPPEPLTSGRIIKSILPCIAHLLSQRSTEIVPVDTGSKKGKKRARGYEGDEVFKVGRERLCESALDGELILASLDALPHILRVPNIPAYLQSLSSRLLLSLLLALPKLSAASISLDDTLKDEILRRVKSACVEFMSGSSAVLCKSLPLVVDATVNDVSSEGTSLGTPDQNALFLDLMLHPRLPPLLRPLPPLDAIALFQSEEGTDERTTRESLGLRSADESTLQNEAVRAVSAASMSTPETQRNISVVIDVPPPNVPVVTSRPIPPVASSTLTEMTAAPPRASPMNEVPELPVSQVTVRQASESAVSAEPVQKEEQRSLFGQPGHQPAIEKILTQPSRPSEHNLMVVDDEDDEDIEMPVINLESDTDSEAGS